MTHANELMRLHVEALFASDRAGRLVAVNDPGADPAPRFFLGRTSEANLCWFRHDMNAALVGDLRALCESQHVGVEFEANPGAAALFTQRLSHDAPVRKTWAGPAFCFPSELPAEPKPIRVTSDNISLLSPWLEQWRADVAAGMPMFAALENGKAVSVCGSVRTTSSAHEAGVETHPDFRGRGYAAIAVRGWARTVRDMDRIPLYSTSWENLASRALARTLGLIQFGSDLHIT